MRHTNWVEGQGWFPAGGDVPRWKDDFRDRFTRCILPTLVKVVFKQQTVGKVEHSDMVQGIGRIPLNGGYLLPCTQFPENISLIRAGDVLLIHSDENNTLSAHVQISGGSYFEMTQTSIHIPAASSGIMDEGLPPAIPFLPDLIVQHEGGTLITGMDGEVLWLDQAMMPKTEVSIPHPMRIRQAVISEGQLLATWLDRELLLACMGAMPVGTAENGKQRSELRTSIGTRTSHYPAGTTWAHALDAEPMAMGGRGDVLVFDLYRRGIYSIGTNAQEHWRMPPAEWGYPKKRPRNEETIALHVHNETYTLTSRGGRIQRRSLDTGHLIEEHLIDGVEAPIEHHFNHEGEDLMCSSTGTVSWLQNGEMVQQVQLSGPVQGAVWDVEFNGWRIAGWREEVVISPHHLDRRATRELPIHIHPVSGGAFVLFNDGTWASSPFENVVQNEN